MNTNELKDFKVKNEGCISQNCIKNGCELIFLALGMKNFLQSKRNSWKKSFLNERQKKKFTLTEILQIIANNELFRLSQKYPI